MMDIIFYKNKNKRYKTSIRNIILTVIALFLFFNLSACSILSDIEGFYREKFLAEGDMEGAVETVNEFFDLLIDKNYGQAYKYLSSEDKAGAGVDEFSDEFKDVTDIVSIEVKWVEIKNNIAIVCIDLTDSYDGEEKVYRDIEVSLLREEDDSWGIVFWK